MTERNEFFTSVGQTGETGLDDRGFGWFGDLNLPEV